MRSNRATNGNKHILTINSEGTQITELTYGPYNDDGAMYSQYGRFIMYRRLPEDFDKATSTQPYPYELVIKLVEPFPRNYRHHIVHQYGCATYIRQDI